MRASEKNLRLFFPGCARAVDVRAAMIDLDGTMVNTLGDFDLALNGMLAEQQWLPASVLHIGDDKITDLQMAKASGLSACHVGLGDDYLAQLKYEQRLFPLAIPGLERLRRQWRWLSDGSASSGIASRVYAPVVYAFARWLIVRC